MGQAKRRGTFNERKLEAIERNVKEEAKRKEERLERERNLTPEERVKRREGQNLLAVLFGMSAALDKKK